LTLLHIFLIYYAHHLLHLHSFPTRRSSDLIINNHVTFISKTVSFNCWLMIDQVASKSRNYLLINYTPSFINIFNLDTNLLWVVRSEEHTSELQSRFDIVCRLLLEKKKTVLA